MFRMPKDWTERFSGRIERFVFEVGVLDDKARREPVDTDTYGDSHIRNYAGGPVAKLSTDRSEVTNAQVLVSNMERTGINFLSEPFQDQSTHLNRFVKAFLDLVLETGMSKKRVENLLQAVVRNPILKGEYGANSFNTAEAKGFDRHLFHTGQMFKSIIARTRDVRKKA